MNAVPDQVSTSIRFDGLEMALNRIGDLLHVPGLLPQAAQEMPGPVVTVPPPGAERGHLSR